MKNFSVFAMCASMYVLIIILLQVCDGYSVSSLSSEAMAAKRDVSSLDGNQKGFGAGSQSGSGNAKGNSSSPFDWFQISDPTTKSTMNAIYGAMQGNDECTKKTLCIAGNYLQQLPGRDFIFMILGRYIPSDYSLLYDIFRVSVMYGQNCQAYLCSRTLQQATN